jgi:hypothetical protein
MNPIKDSDRSGYSIPSSLLSASHHLTLTHTH